MIAEQPWSQTTLRLPVLPWFAPRSWRSVERAFGGALCREFRQAWLPELEADFRPGVVRLGWRNRALWIYAVMQDDDIFNTATKPNQATWQTGDAFEVFLRPLDQEIYFELHVTPENQNLRLRFPHADALKQAVALREPWQQFAVNSRLFGSRTLVEAGQWRVLMKIPASGIVGKGAEIDSDSQWAFSLSRYDVTRPAAPNDGPIKKVISSTSPHSEPRFHFQHEWERFFLPNSDL